MKGLMGDQSDNIPGVPGVGEKTAIKLLVQFDTLENLLNNIDKVSGNKLKERLEEFKDQAIMSKELATITKEAPVGITVDELLYEGYDPSKLSAIFKELGFNSLLDKIDGADESATEEVKEITYETVEEITEELFAKENSFYVEILNDNYMTGEIIGFGLSNENGYFYLPAEKALTSDAFKKWAEDEKKRKSVCMMPNYPLLH